MFQHTALGGYDEQKQSRKNSGNRSVGCSGYDIYRAELSFHFWLVITIRDFVERYSRLNDYGIV